MNEHPRSTAAPDWHEILDRRAHKARVYNYLAGGSLHCALDRDAAEPITEALPCAGALARAQQAFATDAVARMLARGIRQFVDLGAGIPAWPAPAYMITWQAPEATVVMVDSDPHTTALARRLAHRLPMPGLQVVHADLTDITEVLCTHTSAGPLLDLHQPLGILAIDSLHYVTDHHHLRTALAAYRAAVAPGSALAVTVLSDTSTSHCLDAYLQHQAAVGAPVKPVSPETLQSLLAPWTPTPQIQALDDLPGSTALTWASDNHHDHTM